MFDFSIVEKMKQFSENGNQPSGLSVDVTDKVNSYFKELFGCNIPEEYIEFLHIMNGFSYDDRNIFCIYNDDIEKNFPRYASLDFIKFNIRFCENTDITDYIILGKSSISYIGYIKDTGKYVIMDNGELKHIKEFDKFSELITNFLGIS